MEMNPKKALKILGQTWHVKVEKQDDDDVRCFGETDVYARVITIYSEPHKKYPQRGSWQSTLFHEAIHAALASSGAGAFVKEEDGREEALVTALEHALWPLIEQGVFK